MVRPSAISRLDEAGPEDRHDGEREDQRGDRQHQVGEAADEIVPPAAPVAGGEAQRDADQAVADLADDADGERDARAVDDARIDVAALRVGAEREFPAGRDLGVHQVGVHHRIGERDPRRQDRRRRRRARPARRRSRARCRLSADGISVSSYGRSGCAGRSRHRRCRPAC